MSPSTAAESSHPQSSILYIEYHFTERLKTQHDHRVRATTVSLTGDGYTGYRYGEQILGATTPRVRSVAISNLYKRKSTAKERANLVQALSRAGAFALSSDPKMVQTDAYFGSLNSDINGQRRQVYFYLPPRSAARKALHAIMLGFARQLGIDKQTPNSITITEGDRQPARRVALADVIARPDKYHGKRISVAGYYHSEFESSSLSINKAASRARRYKSSVWQSGASSFANKAAIKAKNDAWLRGEGTFLPGPGGHMGLWPGEIVRVTRIAPELPRTAVNILEKLKAQCDDPKVSNASEWTSYLSKTELMRVRYIDKLQSLGMEAAAAIRHELPAAQGEYKEMLIIGLVAHKDDTAVRQTAQLMLKAKRPAVRVCAAFELRRLDVQNRGLIEPFKQALSDPFQREDGACLRIGNGMIYPVREIALGALARLGVPPAEMKVLREKTISRPGS